MSTKYIKVDSEDRLPTENDQYYTSNGLLDFCLRKGKGDFWDENDDFEIYPYYWLEEVTDNEESLLKRNEELEEMIQSLIDTLGYLEAYELPIYDEATELLNKK